MAGRGSKKWCAAEKQKKWRRHQSNALRWTILRTHCVDEYENRGPSAMACIDCLIISNKTWRCIRNVSTQEVVSTRTLQVIILNLLTGWLLCKSEGLPKLGLIYFGCLDASF
jgi:hypothetical protein